MSLRRSTAMPWKVGSTYGAPPRPASRANSPCGSSCIKALPGSPGTFRPPAAAWARGRRLALFLAMPIMTTASRRAAANYGTATFSLHGGPARRDGGCWSRDRSPLGERRSMHSYLRRTCSSNRVVMLGMAPLSPRVWTLCPALPSARAGAKRRPDDPGGAGGFTPAKPTTILDKGVRPSGPDREASLVTRTTAGLTVYKYGPQHHPSCRCGSISEAGLYEAKGLLSHSLRGLRDHREARMKQVSPFEVVEGHQGEVGRDAHPGVAGGAHSTDRHSVIADHDRGRALRQSEQPQQHLLCRVVPRITAAYVITIQAQMIATQPQFETYEALLRGAEPCSPGDHGDAAVPDAHEVVNKFSGWLDILHADLIDVRI